MLLLLLLLRPTPRAVKPVLDRKLHCRLYPNSLEIVAITPGSYDDDDDDDSVEGDDVVFHTACVEVFIIEPNPKT